MGRGNKENKGFSRERERILRSGAGLWRGAAVNSQRPEMLKMEDNLNVDQTGGLCEYENTFIINHWGGKSLFLKACYKISRLKKEKL